MISFRVFLPDFARKRFSWGMQVLKRTTFIWRHTAEAGARSQAGEERQHCADGVRRRGCPSSRDGVPGSVISSSSKTLGGCTCSNAKRGHHVTRQLVAEGRANSEGEAGSMAVDGSKRRRRRHLPGRPGGLVTTGTRKP